MDVEKFIDEQLEMLKNDFDKSQIKDNVYRYIFKRGMPNFNINSLIFQCMDLYSQIIIKHLNK